jgi:hypothetical protein
MHSRFNPLEHPKRLFMRSARYWLLKKVYICFTAPFHAVRFPDFWLADQMMSLVTFFTDMEYFVCFYATEVEYSSPITSDLFMRVRCT